MQSMKPLAMLGMGLVLALAGGASAAPIHLGPAGAPASEGSVPDGDHAGRHAWNRHGPHHGHRLGLRDLLERYGRCSRGSGPAASGFGGWNEALPIRKDFCGGAPGAGLAHFPPDGSAAPEGDAPYLGDGDDGQDDLLAAEGPADESDGESGRLPDGSVPAVPEPGSSAMFGAGALGLLAARFLLKKDR